MSDFKFSAKDFLNGIIFSIWIDVSFWLRGSCFINISELWILRSISVEKPNSVDFSIEYSEF